MVNFPFTFSHAGRTFSVVSDGPSTQRGDGAPSVADRRDRLAAEVFVRIIGIRGLHDLGLVDAAETPDQLRDRVCRWYAETYWMQG